MIDGVRTGIPTRRQKSRPDPPSEATPRPIGPQAREAGSIRTIISGTWK